LGDAFLAFFLPWGLGDCRGKFPFGHEGLSLDVSIQNKRGRSGRHPLIVQGCPLSKLGFGQALYYSAMGKLQALWFISMLLSDIWAVSLLH
jgi:hypothetical protein